MWLLSINSTFCFQVVDSADRERMGISKQELVNMLGEHCKSYLYFRPEYSTFQIADEEELKSAIVVVLANKQDLAQAMSVSEIHKALGLDALKNRTFQIFKVSALKGEGLDQVMEWCVQLVVGVPFSLRISVYCRLATAIQTGK